jgi:Spy/CpxP family protein refolding chaperone
MKTRVIKTAGALLLGFLMITAVNAQNRQGGRGQGYNGSEKGYGHQFAKLELSEEQQAEITSLRTGHYKEITPLKNKMAELKARERTLLSVESVDIKAVNKTIDEQTDLMNSIRKLQVEQQVAVKSLLTDEQVMQVQQRRQFAKRSGFHGKSGHRGNRAYRGAGGAAMGRGYRGI